MNNHDENLPDKITPLNMVPNQDEPAYKFLGIQLDSKLNLNIISNIFILEYLGPFIRLSKCAFYWIRDI